MSARRVLLFVGLPLTLCAIAGAWWLSRPKPNHDIATAEVRIGDVEQTVLASGKLMPKALVSVGAQVSGQVKRLYVTLGQTVRTGDPIADIDAQPQQVALRDAESAVAALAAQKEARTASLRQAQLTFQRQKTMLQADATSRSDYEAAEAAMLALRGELKSLDAQIAQARTKVETARLDLGFTRIVAPMDGTVVAVVTKQGQTVNSLQSAPTIVMLARLDVMTVRAEISEADVEKVRPGLPVRFTTLGAPNRSYSARIGQVEPAPESIVSEGTGTGASGGAGGPASANAVYYNALFDVENPQGRLRPSMTVQVTVVLEHAKRAVTVPSSALVAGPQQGQQSVRVVDAHGRISQRPVRIGITDDSNAVVLSGLKPGEKVVIAEAKATPSGPGQAGGF